MAVKNNTVTEKWRDPSMIEWLTFDKVGAGSGVAGDAYRKVEKVPTTVRIAEVDANTTYVGSAIVGSASSSAVWKVQKIVTSGVVTSITWADGNSNYDNVWDDYATLSYS